MANVFANGIYLNTQEEKTMIKHIRWKSKRKRLSAFRSVNKQTVTSIDCMNLHKINDIRLK